MFMRQLRRSLLCVCLSLCGAASAQVLGFPRGDPMQSMTSVDAIQNGELNFNLFTINSQSTTNSAFQSLSGSVSALDLRAPGKARKEFVTGYQLLLKKDSQGAVEHLTNAVTIYPKFVSAHNALGTAYLDLQKNQEARDEFTKATALDDHLPNSFLNLGIAQLALKQNAQAEDSFRKASSLAPLDDRISLALAYGEFVNQDYPAVLATKDDVHKRKHGNAATVHFFAAGAYEAQHNFIDAQHEIETLLQEEPNSESTPQFRVILDQIKTEQASQAEAKLHPTQAVQISFTAENAPTADQATQHARQVLQNVKESNQITEAEAAPDAVGTPMASNSMPAAAPQPAASSRPNADLGKPVFRSSTDEVAIFFAATDHGKSVTTLTASDVGLLDDNRPPKVILGFRNESQLPLRLGLILDTSDSVKDRFAFEQGAANKFLQAVMTGPNDLAFVLGVNNSVLQVQDFTADLTQTAHAVNQLAPGGGTALWDAVSFAADKLSSRVETQPVSRVLVVISDGEDNSSSATLKEAIASAQHGDVAIYSVGTSELDNMEQSAEIGKRAMQTLSELTGGAAVVPGSLRRLNGSLAELQQVIRGRYLVSYRPAAFQRDGHYRAIDISAQKDGHKLKVFARKGYYAGEQSETRDR